MSSKIKRLFRQYVSPNLKKLIYRFRHKKAHSDLYAQTHKETLFPIMDWENPITHDQKIHWLMVNKYDSPDIGFYADKVRVREYVKECGFEDMLIPIYEVHEKVEDFDVSKVPESFILKANHGSGTVFYEFIKDKNDKTHMDFALEKMKKALKIDYSKAGYEYNYHYIKPLVYAEQLLSDGHERVNDYKIYVIHGKAKFVLVCTERNSEGEPLLNTYDLQWKEVDFICKNLIGKIVPQPESLDAMIVAAEKIASPFCCARIDFYEVGEKPYFGEITLTPAAGNAIYFTDEAQIKIGEMIEL